MISRAEGKRNPPIKTLKMLIYKDVQPTIHDREKLIVCKLAKPAKSRGDDAYESVDEKCNFTIYIPQVSVSDQLLTVLS